MPSVVQVLTTADPMQKAALTHRAWQQFCAGSMSVGVAQPSDRPARPEVPQVRTFWYASAPDLLWLLVNGGMLAQPPPPCQTVRFFACYDGTAAHHSRQTA